MNKINGNAKVSEVKEWVGSVGDEYEQQVGRHCVLKCLELVKSDMGGGLVFLIVGMRGDKYEIKFGENHYEVLKDLVKII